MEAHRALRGPTQFEMALYCPDRERMGVQMKLLIKISREESGVYRAWCPALPGCVAHGASRQEAGESIDEAVNGYLASLNVPIPAKVERELLEVTTQ